MNGATPPQMALFPSTRYMGSKSKLIPVICEVASQLSFSTVLDLFSGTGIVAYLMKVLGKGVVANDYMVMAATYSRALVQNSRKVLSEEDVRFLLEGEFASTGFVQKTFAGLYFSDEDNRFIDHVRTRIPLLGDGDKEALAMAALMRTCIKKRPRGIFTYTGVRYDDGRRDLRLSFAEQFHLAVEAYNAAVFEGRAECQSRCGDALDVIEGDFDLVYLDPPYYSPHSDNEYVRRYHFVEGLARNWEGVEIQEGTKTKKFKSYPTPFSTETGARDAFEELFSRYCESTLLVSYSSNSLPNREEMVALLRNAGKSVEVVPVDHRYSFGNQGHARTHRNNVQEYLFLGV